MSCQRKPFQNYVILHHCCTSQLGCKMFCLRKRRGKGNMKCVQLLEKVSVVTPASCQQKIIFLMTPTLRKCVKILSIQWKRGNNIQKTYTTQSGPTRADITKAKHTTTDPADNSKITKRRTITRDTNKEIKVNGAYKKVGNI